MATQEIGSPKRGESALRWAMHSRRKEQRHLTLQGEWDLATESQAEEIFDYALDGCPGSDLIVDLTGLEFMGCCAVRLLARTVREAEKSEIRMRIRAQSAGPVRRVLTILGPQTGLDRILEG
jgi:anti-anti-sigma factor